MNVENIDVISIEAFEAGFAALDDIAARCAAGIWVVFIHRYGEFGG